jgi:DNA-3-methyladenine glycosylase I
VEAYDGFDIDQVAAYSARDIKRLMGNAGIIRNRLKIEAAINNAKRLQDLRQSHGSFAQWLDAHHPLPKEEWVKLFRKTFRFTGGEIVGEFLLSLGYLPGAHEAHCPIYTEILRHNPPWQSHAAISPVK